MSYSLAVRFLLQVPAHSRQNKTSSQSVNMRAMATTHGVVRVVGGKAPCRGAQTKTCRRRGHSV